MGPTVPLLELHHTSPTSLSVQLRLRTRDAHVAAEAGFDLDGRLVDRAAYGLLLELLRGFYGPLEQALEDVTGWRDLDPPVDVAARRRAHLLDDDLDRLPPRSAPAEATSSPALALDGLADALGCLYVLEGSRLGGRVVARTARLRLGADLPVTFFSGPGDRDPRTDWQALRATLDGFGRSQGETACTQVAAAAERTFGSLQRRLVAPASS